MRKYKVILSYPIEVNAEDETHVREIIMGSKTLQNATDLGIEITEIKDEE